eukprot:m.32111 g.32111  ORF g.32111 m.32111 type:complete len:330 (+) comp8379_c0_seq1:165-1154(+)
MFKAEDFRKRLQNLSQSQQSVQALSLWLLHNKKNASEAISIWNEEIEKAVPEKKTNLLYLANDALLNDAKSTSDITILFKESLPKVVKDALRTGHSKVMATIEKLIKIWEERKVFSASVVEDMRIAGKEVNLRNKPTFIKFQLQVLGNVEPSNATNEVGETATVTLQALEELLKTTMEAAEREQERYKEAINVPRELTSKDSLNTLRNKSHANLRMSAMQSARTKLEQVKSSLMALASQRASCVHDLQTYKGQVSASIDICRQQITECREQLKQAKNVKRAIVDHMASLPDPTPSQLDEKDPQFDALFGDELDLGIVEEEPGVKRQKKI